MNLNEIIKTVRENALINYDRDKHLTNTNEGAEMIEFCSKTLMTRNAYDGGDEDEDMFIGLDKRGWVKYINRNLNCGGAFRILNESYYAMTDEELELYLTSGECTNIEYMSFMSKAVKYYPKF